MRGWRTTNTARPHQSCGGRPPAERFQLADRNKAAVEPGEVAAPAARPVRARQRPAGVSRWVNAHGKISLGGFTYAAGASYAGEPVEAVVAGGLAEILHAGPRPLYIGGNERSAALAATITVNRG